VAGVVRRLRTSHTALAAINTAAAMVIQAHGGIVEDAVGTRASVRSPDGFWAASDRTVEVSAETVGEGTASPDGAGVITVAMSDPEPVDPEPGPRPPFDPP
jgi:hypothetical protein